MARKIWTMPVIGYGATEEECWNDFDNELKNIVFFTNGFRYWRAAPEYHEEHDFQNGHDYKRVVSRLIITDTEFSGNFGGNIRGIPAFDFKIVEEIRG